MLQPHTLRRAATIPERAKRTVTPRAVSIRVVSNGRTTTPASPRFSVDPPALDTEALAMRTVSPVDAAETPGAETGEAQPPKIQRSAKFKHGLNASYLEKPFEELEDELKQEGGEIKLPDSIYTVAFCSGFFADANTWKAIQDQLDAALETTLSATGISQAKVGPKHVAATAGQTKRKKKMSCRAMFLGFLKNVWLMFVNAFVPSP
jgi:hypothetical protein